ncbi:gasdermin-E [Polypterus senegalus]|uniref:gasdermin-E n=1 Tax=Polypterus senegalus TaxID=55291 RepID=UPI001962989B|nr:gasdermin-E [Polypterus senegalus]
MFAKATSNFVKQIDSDGDLIPVSRLNDSDKIQPASLVIKKKRFWFWQKPRYIPLSFSLNEILHGEPTIIPAIEYTLLQRNPIFLKYEGTFEGTISGKIGTGVGNMNLKLEGKGSSKLQSSFGNLKKQELDVHHLLKHSKGRILNMAHFAVRKTQEKKNEVFCVVKEKIFTTQMCSITEEVKATKTFAGILGWKEKRIEVCVNDGSNILKDSSVQLEIPPSTVVAYSVIELHIMVNGEYELCVLSDSWGGFETDSSSSGSLAWPSDQVMLVDASRLQCQTTAFQLSSADEKKVTSEAPLSVLKPDLDGFKHHFQPFAEMPEEKRYILFKLIKEILFQKDVITVVDNVLDQLSTGETPDLSELEELYSSQRESATALLRSLGLHYMDGKEMEPTEHCQECPDIVKASHMLISALKEMTEEALAELGNCYDIIPSLHLLVSHIIHNGKASLDEEPLTCLASEKTFLKAQSLFASSDINLQAADSTIKATAGQQPGHLPFLLCLVLDGLATLSARS